MWWLPACGQCYGEHNYAIFSEISFVQWLLFVLIVDSAWMIDSAVNVERLRMGVSPL